MSLCFLESYPLFQVIIISRRVITCQIQRAAWHVVDLALSKRQDSRCADYHTLSEDSTLTFGKPTVRVETGGYCQKLGTEVSYLPVHG